MHAQRLKKQVGKAPNEAPIYTKLNTRQQHTLNTNQLWTQKARNQHSIVLTGACRKARPGHDEDELGGGGGGVLGGRGRLAAAGLGPAGAEHASAVPACGGHEQLSAGESVRRAAGAEARHHGRPQEADQELVRARRVQLLRRVLRAGARRLLPAHGGRRGPQPRRPRRHAPRRAGTPVRPRRLPPQLQPLLRLPP
jgi:hypothetical protein